MFLSVVIISLMFINIFATFFFCCNAISVLGYVALGMQWLMSDEFGRFWNDVVVT